MFRQRKGSVLVITLGILTMMAVMGASFAVLMRTEYEATQNYMLAQRAKLIANDGVIAAGKNLQDLLTYSYYSSLYDDNADTPEYLKQWCYGVDKTKGNYTKDISGQYTTFGVTSLTDNLAPVVLPYPYVDSSEKAPYIDFNGDGEYKEEDGDELLEELTEKTKIFYDDIDERTLFSGFPADGRFLGNVDVIAGQTFVGGNRYKLKILETNSQLSMNYLGSTMYDFLVSADPLEQNCPGSQFKYMLYFLGQGILKVLGDKIGEDLKTELENPFNQEVVDKLWELRTSYGESFDVQQFSSKTQIRSIVDSRYWKYVKDFITISAWPGYNTVYAKYNPNTIVPIASESAYKAKLGEYDYQSSNPELDSTPGKMTAVNVIESVQPPVDCNTATLPVLYANIAYISGDARFWYFSPDPSAGNNFQESLYAHEPDVDPYILADECRRAQRLWASNERSIITSALPSDTDSKTYHYAGWGSIAENEKDIKQYDNFQFQYGEATGNTVFKRNYQMLQYLNISPFRAAWDVEDMDKTDYAYNFAQAVEELRPFTGWADFDKRVIQDIIIKNKGLYNSPNHGQLQICEPFNDFWHPWNVKGPGSDPNCDVDQDYLEQWYYEAVSDLLRANFNPTPKLTKFNPDAAYYQKIDRSDLVYWTVPFTFINPGVFEVTSIGEIIGQVFDPEAEDYIPKPVVQKQYQAIIKVADVVRHHSQEDFTTGFPNEDRAFKEELDDYSVVRLYAHENDDPAYRRYSRVTTYPQPVNEDVMYSHIKDHERINRGSPPPDSGPNRWERTYYTGFYTTSASGHNYSQELLYGNTTASSIPVGYVTVRPQDTGPFDYEMRVDQASGNAYMGTPNNIQSCNYASGNTVGSGALDISKKNTTGKEEGAWLNFWMPFNETYNTIAKGASLTYGNMQDANGNSYQSARIGSEKNNTRPNANSITSVGLIWNASGYTFRSFDFKSWTFSEKYIFPNYLEYPAGVGYSTTGADNDENQTANLIEAEDIIKIMPHEDLQLRVTDMDYEESDEYNAYQKNGSEGTHRQDQWLRQKQTNFPYYQGTVEFWFKSDIDQWDMTAEGYDSDEDTFYGGFVSANVLVQADPESGIQGCQTFIFREMGNVFRVSRIYFVDAIKGEVGGTSMNHWVADESEGGAGSGEGHGISVYIYKRGDTVPDINGLDSNPGDEVNHFKDLDQGDLGFLFTRYDSWYNLSDREQEFKWRPHEWYHLAFSFKSDASLKEAPWEAINFFINGVYVDNGIQNNYPTTRMNKDNHDTWNTGTILIGETWNNISMATDQVLVPQKLAGIINEVIPENDHSARLVIGAIKRNQATEDQFNSWTEDTLTKEMFYFADGPFVEPCNGTMDAVRITGKYLDAADTDITGGQRIQAFARYNTEPGETSPGKLGSYQNGFPNSWGRDVRIANINWNEYRPKWDSALSEEIMYDDSAFCELTFWSFEVRGDGFDRNGGYRSFGYDNAISNKYKSPFLAKIGTSPNGLSLEGVIESGVAFPKNPANLIGEDIEKFIIPEGGFFVYEVAFYPGGLYAANAAAIFDELTVTILTPVERFSFEEISE